MDGEMVLGSPGRERDLSKLIQASIQYTQRWNSITANNPFNNINYGSPLVLAHAVVHATRERLVGLRKRGLPLLDGIDDGT